MRESYSLYGGEVELVFDSGKHRYTVDGQIIPSVTSIVGVIDKSGPLVGWALKEAAAYVRYEIFARSASNDAETLISLSEDDVDAICVGLKGAAKKKSKEAADIGTQAHKWIESHIAAQLAYESMPEMPENEIVRTCVEKFLAWEVNNHVEYVESERKIYSRDLNYAGTLDAIAEVNGVKTLIDFKTSNGLYPEYIIQTAGYELAYYEETNSAVDGRILLRIGKEDGVFETMQLPKSRSDDSVVAFISCLKLYNWIQSQKH